MKQKNSHSHLFLDSESAPNAAKIRYRQRRQALLNQLPGVAVLIGVQDQIDKNIPFTHIHQPYYQDPTFTFFTGINQCNVKMMLDPFSSESKEILFLPTYDPLRVFWEGEQLATGTHEVTNLARKVTGFKDIKPTDQFELTLLQRLGNSNWNGKICLFWHQDGKNKRFFHDHNSQFLKYVKKLIKKLPLNLEFINIAPIVWQMRLQLDGIDIGLIKKANQLATEAFLVTLRSMWTRDEKKIAGKLLGELWERSAFGPSFPPIVASGKNATILHYTKNNDPIFPNDLVLLDFGIRVNTMVSDISRTIPISGIFSPLQSVLYNIVLNAQIIVEKQVKPGITIQALNQFVWQWIENEINNKIVNHGGIAKLYYKSLPHNVSHLIGIQVHEGDPFRSYRTIPLKPGMVISNEPGLYGYFEMDIQGKRFAEWIGIRIEDDLLITENGSENLTPCPKSIDHIEHLLALN